MKTSQAYSEGGEMKLPEQFNDACEDGVAYLKSQKSLKQAWNNCKNVEWMLWALDKIGFKDDKNLRLFAAKCVCDTPLGDGRYCYELLTDKRSRDAIDAAVMFAYGKITEEDRAAARAAAGNAAWDAWDAWDARYAALAARAAAGDAGDAALAARDAALAARDAAGDAARDAQSNILREFVPWENIEKYFDHSAKDGK